MPRVTYEVARIHHVLHCLEYSGPSTAFEIKRHLDDHDVRATIRGVRELLWPLIEREEVVALCGPNQETVYLLAKESGAYRR